MTYCASHAGSTRDGGNGRGLRTGAEMDVGGEDVVEVGRDGDFVVFEIVQPGSLGSAGVAEGAGDVAKAHRHAGFARLGFEFVAGK